MNNEKLKSKYSIIHQRVYDYMDQKSKDQIVRNEASEIRVKRSKGCA